MHDWIGWLATGVFASSYFSKNAAKICLVQAVAAGIWIVYGVSIHALPLIGANVIIGCLAAYSAWKR